MLGMICSVKPVLTEDFCVVQKEEFSITCYMGEHTLGERLSVSIRDKLILSSGKMLKKDHYRRSSVGKTSLVVGLKECDAKTN
jgi:hypothetical protein